MATFTVITNGATASTLSTIWCTWTNDNTITTTTNTTSPMIWTNWIAAPTTDRAITYQTQMTFPVIIDPTYDALRREADEAAERARVLLDESLTDEQRAEYQETRSFRVLSADGERVYRIEQGTHGNVKLLDAAGKVCRSFCIQPGGVPTEDAMLAQKLWLETDEPTFLRIANARDVA